jgi:transglutaminase-like putative cysteine protease
MEKKLFILLLLLFLVSTVVFADEDYSNTKYLDIDMTVGSRVLVIPESFDYSLRDVSVEMSFYPREDFRQEIDTLRAEPDWIKPEDEYIFRWDEVEEKELSFNISASLRTRNQLVMVKETIDFPLKAVPQEARAYIEETPIIDYNHPKIRKLANELAAGEDDLYSVLFIFADFVNSNISYNLTSKTSKASQTASWTLEEGYGVCDELTSLFIALCRAVSIPARFVSGVSYTESCLFFERWSPHGWAEVYIPEYGWVPFDVTYGQYGWIDAGHIKLKESIDANKTGTRYQWSGRDVKLTTRSLSIDTEVREKGPELEPLLEIEAEVLKDEIAFGSYNLLTITLRNPNSFYYATKVMLSRTSEIELFGDYQENVLLKPNSEKTISRVIQLDRDLDEGYIYNFTIKAETSRRAQSRVSFLSRSDARYYAEEEVSSYINDEEEEKEFTSLLEVMCYPSRDRYYSYDEIDVHCLLNNQGNTVQEGIEISIGEQVHKFDLGIGNEKELTFRVANDIMGDIDLLVNVKSRDLNRKLKVSYKVIGDAQVEISQLEYPEKIAPDQKFQIVFMVEKNTSTEPADIIARLRNKDLSKEWDIDNLSVNRRFIVNVGRYYLSEEYNDFQLTVEYRNRQGDKKVYQKSFTITQPDLTMIDRVKIAGNKLTLDAVYWIGGIILGLFFALLLISLIFRRSPKEDIPVQEGDA